MYYKVLDKGFVGLVDHMGDDSSIVQAARVSYGTGTKKSSDDRNLIRYLMRHNHTSPFEMCELKFHVKVPMDCWRQWIRHRTASVNEYSTRYSEAIQDKQETQPDKWRLQATDNKQGSGGYLTEFPEGYGPLVIDGLGIGIQTTPGYFLTITEQNFHDDCERLYKERLKFGVAREQARKDLPLSTYTEAYWKIDLHNLFHFLRLRLDPHAQLEIRSYAHVIACIIKELYPVAFEAFLDYQLNTIKFSGPELVMLHSTITHNTVQFKSLSEREYKEFDAKMKQLYNNTILFSIEQFNVKELEEYEKKT